ncbi:hypothetical protein CVT26_009179 [Gymnopilus dilepis]|uniref:Uncharacterized protein n=1 Tax=Gymnopilus dilepis TaxID=231916 RepID=A0A409WUL7_9AGAR|nr:hypothetical protein CVT26_009179 [Gymnopilus dilepis]
MSQTPFTTIPTSNARAASTVRTQIPTASNDSGASAGENANANAIAIASTRENANTNANASSDANAATTVQPPATGSGTAASSTNVSASTASSLPPPILYDTSSSTAAVPPLPSTLHNTSSNNAGRSAVSLNDASSSSSTAARHFVPILPAPAAPTNPLFARTSTVAGSSSTRAGPGSGGSATQGTTLGNNPSGLTADMINVSRFRAIRPTDMIRPPPDQLLKPYFVISAAVFLGLLDAEQVDRIRISTSREFRCHRFRDWEGAFRFYKALYIAGVLRLLPDDDEVDDLAAMYHGSSMDGYTGHVASPVRNDSWMAAAAALANISPSLRTAPRPAGSLCTRCGAAIAKQQAQSSSGTSTSPIFVSSAAPTPVLPRQANRPGNSVRFAPAPPRPTPANGGPAPSPTPLPRGPRPVLPPHEVVEIPSDDDESPQPAKKVKTAPAKARKDKGKAKSKGKGKAKEKDTSPPTPPAVPPPSFTQAPSASASRSRLPPDAPPFLQSLESNPAVALASLKRKADSSSASTSRPTKTSRARQKAERELFDA